MIVMEIVGDFLVRGWNSCQTRGTMVKSELIGYMRILYKHPASTTQRRLALTVFLIKLMKRNSTIRIEILRLFIFLDWFIF
jgi:hypothetical protein